MKWSFYCDDFHYSIGVKIEKKKKYRKQQQQTSEQHQTMKRCSLKCETHEITPSLIENCITFYILVCSFHPKMTRRNRCIWKQENAVHAYQISSIFFYILNVILPLQCDVHRKLKVGKCVSVGVSCAWIIYICITITTYT